MINTPRYKLAQCLLVSKYTVAPYYPSYKVVFLHVFGVSVCVLCLCQRDYLWICVLEVVSQIRQTLNRHVVNILLTPSCLAKFKFQVSSLLREIKKNTKSDVPLLAVSYSYSRRAVA